MAGGAWGGGVPGRVANLVVICGFVSDGGIMVYDGERCITVARAVYCRDVK